MKNKKMRLDNLSVKSFVTEKSNRLTGGYKPHPTRDESCRMNSIVACEATHPVICPL